MNHVIFFSGDVEELEIQEKPALKVFKNITVIQEPGMVVLEVSPVIASWGSEVSDQRGCDG